MARFFAPTVEYKAPTFQELAAPLAVYQSAYNDLEEKYDAQKEKAAMLQAMLGSEGDNEEISSVMSDFNTLLDQTARGYANGSMPYSQLYNNYRRLKDIWQDKGLKMTNAIDLYTKYRDAKKPGYIGPDYSLTDFYKHGNTLSYSFFNPDDVYKAGALAGTAYAQQNGPRNGKAINNGRWIDEYGPSNEQVATAFTDVNNPFNADATNIMRQYGIDPNSQTAELFRNAYQRGLASSQRVAVSKNEDYINKYQRIQTDKASKAERKQEELERLLGPEGKKYRQPVYDMNGNPVKAGDKQVYWIPKLNQRGVYPIDENGKESDYFSPLGPEWMSGSNESKEEDGGEEFTVSKGNKEKAKKTGEKPKSGALPE